MRIDPARLGKWGEDVACAFLVVKGLRIVARNYRLGRYELDLIAMDGGELVFVEVKLRRSGNFGGPMGAVGFKKQNHLTRAAAAYVADKRPNVRSCRFDVVAIVLDEDCETVTLQHIRGAFVSGASGLFV
jgi:putative endonuclease